MRRLPRRLAHVVSEVVRASTPAHPHLEVATRTEVHADVARFVVSQIEALPSFLKLPYVIAIVVFNWLSLLRHRRTFGSLHSEAQASYLSAWDSGRIAATRNFVKLIRSCALLAFYDHPAVRRALGAERDQPAHAAGSLGR